MNPFGLVIQSELALPGCTSSTDRPDVIIEYGSVPETLPGSTMQRVCSWVKEGQFLLIVENVAGYLVEEGHHITIQRSPGATEEEIRLFLMGSPWAALLLQRGILPLHGSAVRVNDRAVILSGHSGNGKSTLAAALVKKGFPLISDELCGITFDDNDSPQLLPGFPQILLWKDSLKHLNHDPQSLTQARPSMEKYVLPCSNTWEQNPVPLKELYILSVINTPGFTFNPVKGMNKIPSVIDCTYRFHQVIGLGLQKSHFQQCVKAAQVMRIQQVERPSAPFDIDGLTEEIMGDFQ